MAKNPWWDNTSHNQIPSTHMHISRFVADHREACKFMVENDLKSLKLMYRGKLMGSFVLPEQEN